MVKGASIKFTSYAESVSKLLTLLQVPKELKKYDKIVLKPSIKNEEIYTSKEFLESVLEFCIENKNPIAEIFIAEGADGFDTTDLYESIGYRNLAEKYSVGLIDLNDTEVEEIMDGEFLKAESIKYPKILLESCVISLPLLAEDEETEISDSLTNMLGAYPAKYYSGFFSVKKNKIRKWPIKYAVHDIIKCKIPNFSIIDASKYGQILAGLPLDVDKNAAKLLGKDWKSIHHLKLIEESFAAKLAKVERKEEQPISVQ